MKRVPKETIVQALAVLAVVSDDAQDMFSIVNQEGDPVIVQVLRGDAALAMRALITRAGTTPDLASATADELIEEVAGAFNKAGAAAGLPEFGDFFLRALADDDKGEEK